MTTARDTARSCAADYLGWTLLLGVACVAAHAFVEWLASFPESIPAANAVFRAVCGCFDAVALLCAAGAAWAAVCGYSARAWDDYVRGVRAAEWKMLESGR